MQKITNTIQNLSSNTQCLQLFYLSFKRDIVKDFTVIKIEDVIYTSVTCYFLLICLQAVTRQEPTTGLSTPSRRTVDLY